MNDWFKLERLGDGSTTDPYRPKLHGHQVDGFSGNISDSNGGPPYLVRVTADRATLDALEADLNPGGKRLSNVPTGALNAMLGQERDAEGWNQGFRGGGGSG